MVTKYTTGQAILVPAVIRSAREVNGQIVYQVDTDRLWDGVPEADVIVDNQAAARAEFNKAMTELSREIIH